MVIERGQTTTEFILMLAILTAIGILLMTTLVGPTGNSGAVQSSLVSTSNSQSAINKIVKD